MARQLYGKNYSENDPHSMNERQHIAKPQQPQ